MEKARLEAFSDGVFAVAITLLALDLAVAGPGHGNGSLASQLGDRWPSYAAYVVSFFTIGITWVNHHTLFRSFAIVDRMLLFLNLTLLLFIVAIPFGTATAAAYLRHGGADAHLAAAIYAGILEGMALSFAAIFAWSVRSDERRHTPLPPETVRSALFRFGAGSFVYLAAFAIAFVSAPAALVVIALVAIYYVFERTPTVDSERAAR
jgi:TMEM175 potassium channel family protein